MLKEETLAQIGRREYEDPQGTFLEMISSGSNTITVLTKVEADNEQEVQPPFDPSEFNVGPLEDKLQETDPTDEQLDALIEEEQQKKNRKTAVAALKNQ